jgi:hypothetical protein
MSTKAALIAVFDVGKTNAKLTLVDRAWPGGLEHAPPTIAQGTVP